MHLQRQQNKQQNPTNGRVLLFAVKMPLNCGSVIRLFTQTNSIATNPFSPA